MNKYWNGPWNLLKWCNCTDTHTPMHCTHTLSSTLEIYLDLCVLRWLNLKFVLKLIHLMFLAFEIFIFLHNKQNTSEIVKNFVLGWLKSIYVEPFCSSEDLVDKLERVIFWRGENCPLHILRSAWKPWKIMLNRENEEKGNRK